MQALYEWLTARFQKQPADVVRTETLEATHPDYVPNQPAFYCKFTMHHHRLEEPVEVRGPAAQNKMKARDAMARAVLLHFGADPKLPPLAAVPSPAASQ